MSTKIMLSMGKLALIDEDDAEWLNRWKWHANRDDSTGAFRARRFGRMEDGTSSGIFMHRAIMKAPYGWQVDHIDQDTLNNQRANLRLVTPSQNQWNKDKQSNNTSGFKGVSWCKPANKWLAQIQAAGQHFRLGLFTSPEEAHQAYRDAANRLHGDFQYSKWVKP